jgi:hypothetical protein
VNQQMHIAAPRRDLDFFGPGDQRTGARFEPQPVERRLAQRSFGPCG